MTNLISFLHPSRSPPPNNFEANPCGYFEYTFGQDMLYCHVFDLYGLSLPILRLSPSILSLVHSILVMLALLSLHSIKLIPASGPLHLLFLYLEQSLPILFRCWPFLIIQPQLLLLRPPLITSLSLSQHLAQLKIFHLLFVISSH